MTDSIENTSLGELTEFFEWKSLSESCFLCGDHTHEWCLTGRRRRPTTQCDSQVERKPKVVKGIPRWSEASSHFQQETVIRDPSVSETAEKQTLDGRSEASSSCSDGWTCLGSRETWAFAAFAAGGWAAQHLWCSNVYELVSFISHRWTSRVTPVQLVAMETQVSSHGAKMGSVDVKDQKQSLSLKTKYIQEIDVASAQ